MTEKRFAILDGIKKGTHSGIWDNQKQNNQRMGDELWVGEVVGMLNEGVMIAEENTQLKSRVEHLERKIDRERTSYQKQHEKWQTEATQQITKLKKENDELKQQLKTKYIINKQYEELQRLKEENKQLKLKNNGLKSELTIHKTDIQHSTMIINELQDKNKQIKKELEYIQNSISEHIKHQKTELGQKALQEIIADYNEWMLGHKEAKE